MKESSLEHQAVLNLLHLDDEDILENFKDKQENTEFKILSEKSQAFRTNTFTIQKLNFTTKIKTEVSADKPLQEPHNKENLKKILEKLKDSPLHSKKKAHKKRQVEFVHVKTINSEPQSRSKSLQRSPDPIKKSIQKIKEKERERQLIKSLVKAKIVEKLKFMEDKKTQRQLRQQNFRISTLREIPGLKRGQMALNRKEAGSFHNLRGDPSINLGALLNGRNSQVNLKHLLF